MTATVIRLITGVHAHWIGVDPPENAAPDGSPPQPRVFFANHSSNLDGPVIWASLPKDIRRRTRPVAAQDYWLRGPVRRYLARRVFNCVLVERKKVTVSNNPLRDMQAALDAGDSLIIFPEGTRDGSADGGLAEFKPGLWHLSRKFPQAHFIPVHLENLSRILPKGEFLLIPLLASARFGAPLDIAPKEPRESFLARAKTAVENLRDGVPN